MEKAESDDWGVQETANVLPMATIKTQMPVTTPDIDEDEIEETAADRIARVLTIVGNDDRAEVRVYRKAKPGYAMEWCKNYTPEEFEAGGNLALIRRDWGPGLYQIRLYGISPKTGVFAIRAREDISIADDPSSKIAPTFHPPAESKTDQLIAMMMDQNAKIIEKLSERPDPMASMTNTIALLAQVKGLFGSDNAKTPIGEIVSAIKELKGAAEEISPSAKDEPTNLLGLGSQLLGMIQASQEKNANVGQIPIVAAPPVIAQAPIKTSNPSFQNSNGSPAMANNPPGKVEPPATNLAENADMSIIQVIETFKSQIKELLQMQKDNKPIDEAADMVYEKLPDEAIELFMADNWFTLLCQFEPECAPHQEWLTNVRAKTIEYFNEDAIDDPTENSVSITDPGLVKPIP